MNALVSWMSVFHAIARQACAEAPPMQVHCTGSAVALKGALVAALVLPVNTDDVDAVVRIGIGGLRTQHSLKHLGAKRIVVDPSTPCGSSPVLLSRPPVIPEPDVSGPKVNDFGEPSLAHCKELESLRQPPRNRVVAHGKEPFSGLRKDGRAEGNGHLSRCPSNEDVSAVLVSSGGEEEKFVFRVVVRQRERHVRRRAVGLRVEGNSVVTGEVGIVANQHNLPDTPNFVRRTRRLYKGIVGSRDRIGKGGRIGIHRRVSSSERQIVNPPINRWGVSGRFWPTAETTNAGKTRIHKLAADTFIEETLVSNNRTVTDNTSLTEGNLMLST